MPHQRADFLVRITNGPQGSIGWFKGKITPTNHERERSELLCAIVDAGVCCRLFNTDTTKHLTEFVGNQIIDQFSATQRQVVTRPDQVSNLSVRRVIEAILKDRLCSGAELLSMDTAIVYEVKK